MMCRQFRYVTAYHLVQHTTKRNVGLVNVDKLIRVVQEMGDKMEDLRHFLVDDCQFLSCLVSGSSEIVNVHIVQGSLPHHHLHTQPLHRLTHAWNTFI